MTGSENRPEAPSHKRLPRQTGLGGRASRPQGNWAVGFASWIWMNWKCKGPHWASQAGQTRSASKSRAHGWAARSHGRGQAQRGHPCHPPPPGPGTRPTASRSPPDPAHRAGPLTAGPLAAGSPCQPSTGLLLRQILIKRILIMINGGGLAARAWRVSRPTSSYRKDKDGKSDPWQGTAHCPTAVGKCSVRKHFLKTSLQGNVRDGLIKDHRPG